MALWKSIQDEYVVDDDAGREFLCQACQALDKAEHYAEEIKRVGATHVTAQGAI